MMAELRGDPFFHAIKRGDAPTRRWVLEESTNGDRWRLSCPATGEIREANNPEALVDAILSDIRHKPGVVVLAEYIAALVDELNDALNEAGL